MEKHVYLSSITYYWVDVTYTGKIRFSLHQLHQFVYTSKTLDIFSMLRHANGANGTVPINVAITSFIASSIIFKLHGLWTAWRGFQWITRVSPYNWIVNRIINYKCTHRITGISRSPCHSACIVSYSKTSRYILIREQAIHSIDCCIQYDVVLKIWSPQLLRYNR